MRKGILFLSGVLVFFVLVLATFAFAYENEVKSAAETLAQFMRESGKKTVAVVDFTDLQGNVMELGRFLAEELSISMVSFAQKDFKVVDRTHLRALLKEHQLSLSGLIDPATAQKVGEISGVEALVTGTITPFGDNVRLALKVIELATADILGSTSVNIGRTQAINELLSREVTQETSILITQEATTASPSLSLTPSTSPEVERYVVEDNVFVFEYKGSWVDIDTLYCELVVEGKRDMALWVANGLIGSDVAGTRFIDDRGVEFRSSKVWLGNVENRNINYNQFWPEYSFARNSLVSGVPMRMLISFEKVPTNIKTIALLEITYSYGETTERGGIAIRKVRLRNLPIVVEK